MNLAARKAQDRIVEPELVRLETDLSRDGRYAGGAVVVTASSVRVLEQGRVVEEIPLAAVEKFEAREMVGGGVLEARVEGEDRLLARFTASHLPRYTAAASYLNKRLQGEEAVLDLPERAVCPTCGRPFPDPASRV